MARSPFNALAIAARSDHDRPAIPPTPGHSRIPPFSPDRDAFVEEAAALARELAPDLQAILITVYPDADTLDTLRPGETDIETATAIARAAAAEMAAAGVELFVQRADKSAFRRWLQGHDDTPDHRRAWIDRERLLRGPAARQALGLPPTDVPASPVFPKAPGPIADQLLAAFADDTGENFASLADALIAAGRGDVLDLALRKLDAQDGENAADDLLGAMLEAAEGAAIGPAGWAELVALPVALPTGAAPDAVALAAGLRASGALAPTEDIRLLAGWRSSDAIADLPPVAVRRVLTDLVAGREPRDLPPGDTDELATQRTGVLIGLRLDWDLPIWDRLAAGGLPDQSAEDSPEDARRAALFDQWRGAVFQATEGCVPLALVPLSEVGAEIAEFLEEAGAQTGGLVEIVAMS